MKNRVAALFVAVVVTGCVTEPPPERGTRPGSASRGGRGHASGHDHGDA